VLNSTLFVTAVAKRPQKRKQGRSLQEFATGGVQKRRYGDGSPQQGTGAETSGGSPEAEDTC